MRFSFRFESILKLRQHQEKIEKQKLAELLADKTELEEEYASLEKEGRSESQTLEKQPAWAARQYYSRKHDLHERLMTLRQKIHDLEVKVRKQRNKLKRANAQTRIMEKLKQKEKQAFIAHVEHLEQLQQNEIAIQRFNTTY